MSEQDFATSETTASEVGKGLGIRPYCVDNMTNDPVDPEDVKKAQNGDDEAFSKLFWQTYRYVFGISRRYLKNDEDIHDAIQDTYTNIYANLKKLKAPEAFVTWVGKIAVTCSRSMAEKIAATKADTLDDDELVEIDDTARDPKTEVTVDVTAVLSQMEPADVELLTYIYYDRLRVAEVARMQSVPLTTVYSRLNAAKRKLKELLKIRGIDKAVYGGDIVAIITTALRNAIGTNLLSMAVAAEILHSVVGKTTKGAAVVAAVARQQRNAAALKIASRLLASAMLMFGIVAVLFYWINRVEGEASAPSSSLTALTSSENSWTDADSSTDKNTSTTPTDSSVGGIINVSSNGVSSQDPLPSSNGPSVNVPPNNSSDSTTSDATVSTGTSGEIGNTDEPDHNGTNTGNTSSSGGTSSSRPSSTVSTSASSSKPSVSSDTTSSDSTVPTVTSLPAAYSSVRFDQAVNTMGNTSNNIFANMTANYGTARYFVAREGNTLYYSDAYSTKTASVNGGGADFGSFPTVSSINVVNGHVCYLYENAVVLPGGSYTAHPGRFLIINGTAYVAERQSSGTYSIYAVDMYMLTDRLIASNVTYITGIAANADMLIYNSGNKLYKYDLKTQKTSLFREDFSGRTLLMCGQYVAYKNRIVNIYDPSIVTATNITPFKFFWHNGGMIVDQNGAGYYLSDLTAPIETPWFKAYDEKCTTTLFETFGFDNEQYVYFSNSSTYLGGSYPEIEYGGMHRLYPDGTGHKCLAIVQDRP